MVGTRGRKGPHKGDGSITSSGKRKRDTPEARGDSSSPSSSAKRRHKSNNAVLRDSSPLSHTKAKHGKTNAPSMSSSAGRGKTTEPSVSSSTGRGKTNATSSSSIGRGKTSSSANSNRTATKNLSREMTTVARRPEPDVHNSEGSSNEDDDSHTDITSRPPSRVETNVPTNLPPTANQRWNHIDAATLVNNRDKRTIEFYVKDIFFPRCKFIRDKTEMEYTPEAKSICQTVCAGCNIPDAQREEWWRYARRKIEGFLNKRRADVNATMKRKFIGKHWRPRSVLIYFHC